MSDRKIRLAVLVAALGYFVDVYDLVLFSIVRIKSLKSLGYDGEALLDHGVFLLNMQMTGLLLGGVLWGVIGDRVGRVKVLFGSITLYSVANIANAFVGSVEAYAFVRVLAGIGLAGELGAGITLVSELMSARSRGYGTTVVATIGVAGAVVAGVVCELVEWRTSYIIGGSLGFLLLFLRIGVYESGLFDRLCETNARRGDLRLLFASRERVGRYLLCILSGVPIWFVVGILITFSPEIAKALNLPESPIIGRAVSFSYIGFFLGDLSSGLLSQYLHSRIRAMRWFVGFMLIAAIAYLNAREASLPLLYFLCGAMGFGGGYWAVFVTTAAEQFGTNLRATVATTVPNFVRGSTVLFAALFHQLVGPLGTIGSAYVGLALSTLLALFALTRIEESHGRDLDFLEE